MTHHPPVADPCSSTGWSVWDRAKRQFVPYGQLPIAEVEEALLQDGLPLLNREGVY